MQAQINIVNEWNAMRDNIPLHQVCKKIHAELENLKNFEDFSDNSVRNSFSKKFAELSNRSVTYAEFDIIFADLWNWSKQVDLVIKLK